MSKSKEAEKDRKQFLDHLETKVKLFKMKKTNCEFVDNVLECRKLRNENQNCNKKF